jgi:hypothetical membrane protein
MPSKIPLSLRAAGICGILAPLIGLLCIYLAIIFSPWFSWTENYLSDLGGSPGDRPIYAAHGLPSILFNFGLIVAGALGICLGIGIRKSRILNTPLGSLGTMIYMVNACALVGIGVFPESTGEPHTFFSLAFFVLIGFSLLFMGIALIRSSERELGWLTMALLFLGLASVPLFLAPKPLGSNAVAELIPIISIAIFSTVFGKKLMDLASEN